MKFNLILNLNTTDTVVAPHAFASIKLIDGPYIHYFVEMKGDYTREITEFCKYFPKLNIDKI